ncbi:MAG TPA: hypothetical protein VK633_12760, partial [Verrucomicrobiae bacterium]|nr:hypothetical protein [Verrucomicrobiae bacterium]
MVESATLSPTDVPSVIGWPSKWFMLEVLTESMRVVNLPFTSMLGGLVIYWLFVALGVFHLGEGDAH